MTVRAQGGNVVRFDQNIDGGPNGRYGQVDVETENTIFEVKSGKNWQGAKYNDQIAELQGPNINPQGKAVVIYAPNFKPSAVAAAQATGAIVITSQEELIMYINFHG
ncbi:MAG TPA: hypothetical protein VFV38_24180 [Ktedonobacteraceae bacterium]|nr:hypothetical protein [Ktedonobacteraceae bacterium]